MAIKGAFTDKIPHLANMSKQHVQDLNLHAAVKVQNQHDRNGGIVHAPSHEQLYLQPTYRLSTKIDNNELTSPVSSVRCAFIPFLTLQIIS